MLFSLKLLKGIQENLSYPFCVSQHGRNYRRRLAPAQTSHWSGWQGHLRSYQPDWGATHLSCPKLTRSPLHHYGSLTYLLLIAHLLDRKTTLPNQNHTLILKVMTKKKGAFSALIYYSTLFVFFFFFFRKGVQLYLSYMVFSFFNTNLTSGQ